MLIFHKSANIYLSALKTCVENKQYISGLAAEFNGAKDWINVAIAIFVCVFGI
jgi:hypothetical protein